MVLNQIIPKKLRKSEIFLFHAFWYFTVYPVYQKGSPLHQEAFKYAEGVASDLHKNNLMREGRRKDVVMWVIVVKKKSIQG